MKKLVATLVVAAASWMAVPAFAKTTVTVWHAYRAQEKKALEKVAADFNKQSADVAVKLVPIPYDAFADKITAAIPRGKGPDLFIFAQDRLGDWAAAGLVESVDFWLTDELRSSFLPRTVDALTYDEQVYGVPIAFKTVALFFNEKLVKQPPKTTGELVKMAKKITNAKKGRFGLVYENANFYYQAAWMQGFGGRVFDDRGKPVLDSKAVVDSMAFAQRLAHAEGIMPQEVSGTLVTTLFNKGDAGFVISGPWFIGEIDKGVKYGVAPLPTIDEAGKPARPFLTVEGMLMSAKTADKKAAFEVMTYFTSVDAGRTMATVGRQTTAKKAVYDDPKVKNDPVLAVFRKQLEASEPTPNTPAMRMVWTPATKALNRIIHGKKDAAESMKDAQAEVKSLVKNARR